VLTVDKRVLVEPYLRGMLGDSEVKIKLYNSCETGIILEQTGGLQVLLRGRGGDRVIDELHPPVEPLLIAPGEALTLTWKLPELPFRLIQPTTYEDELTFRAHFTYASATRDQGAAETGVTIKHPPSCYRWTATHVPQLLLACLGLRLLLACYRLGRAPTSFNQRTPRTALGGLVLDLLVRAEVTAARLNLPLTSRSHLLVSSLTLYRWKAITSAAPAACLVILRRCAEVTKGLEPATLPPANPFFLLYWHMAECLDRLARLGECDRADAAFRVADCYERAASLAGEDDLRRLCHALAHFYHLLRLRLGAAASAKNVAPVNTTGARGATQSVLWATELLRLSMQGGPVAVMAAAAGLPIDLQNIPHLAWAVTQSTPWPPAFSSIADTLSIRDRPLYDKILNVTERLYKYGELGPSFRVLMKLPQIPSSEELFAQGRRPLAYALSLFGARVLAEHHRLTSTLPFGEEKEREHAEHSMRAVSSLVHLMKKVPREEAPGFYALAYALSADLYAIRGWYPAAIKPLGGARAFAVNTEREVIEAAAVAERVRGEIYASCGSPARSQQAFAESSTWFALLGDWARYLETRALGQKVRLSLFDNGEVSAAEVEGVVAKLSDLCDSARQILAKRGHADLYHSWALWGQYLIAIRANDPVRLERVNIAVAEAGKRAGFGFVDLMLFRALAVPMAFIGFLLSKVGRPQVIAASVSPLSHVSLRSRRQCHTIIVLAGFHMNMRLLEAHPVISRLNIRKAEQLVAKSKLDLPDSIRSQTRAAFFLLKYTRGPFSLDAEQVAEVFESSLQAVAALVTETRAAPSETLRQTYGSQKKEVLAMLIHSLELAQEHFPADKFAEAARRAYLVLQGLRAEKWRNLYSQKLLAGASANEADVNRMHALHRRLVLLRDRLSASGGYPRELETEMTALAAIVPELTTEASLDAVKRALERVRPEIAEFLNRQSELANEESWFGGHTRNQDPNIGVPPGRAVVEYFEADGRACAFVIKGSDSIRFFKLQSVKLRDLNKLSRNLLEVAQTRAAGGAQAGPAAAIADALSDFERALRAISDAYWPTELHNYLNGDEHLHIVPWGELWKVPFAALPDPDGKPLVLSKTISLLSSIYFLRGIDASAPVIAPEEITVFAYDADGDTPSKITGLEREIGYLRKRIPAASFYVRDAASPSALLSALAHTRWLHLACHGVTDRTPMFSRLSLAADRTYEDGSLYLYQLQGHYEKLYGVFLNCCDSNLGGAIGDRAETLAIGFLSLGAQAVIGTLGKSIDEVSLKVARNFYEALNAHAPDVALSLSLRRLIRLQAGKKVAGTILPLSHPAAWWPFTVLGSCGARDQAP
jgi:hypothetical protein